MADSSPDSFPRAEAAAAAAAPVDRLRAPWAAEMRTLLASVADRYQRVHLATLVAAPHPGMVFTGPEEMLAIARLQADAHYIQRSALEFDGLTNSVLNAATRSTELLEEADRFWLQPPSAIRRLPIEQQQTLYDLHRKLITAEQPWLYNYMCRLGYVGTEHYSGLKLHVSARSTAEQMELFARILPLLPEAAGFKLGTDAVLSRPVSDTPDPNGRAVDDSNARSAIVIYLSPDYEHLVQRLLNALAVERSSDRIRHETELAPGVFMRAEHHVRARGHGVHYDAYKLLYRDKHTAPFHHDVDRVTAAVLYERPHLMPLVDRWGECLASQIADPRIIVIAALSGIDPEAISIGSTNALRILMAEGEKAAYAGGLVGEERTLARLAAVGDAFAALQWAVTHGDDSEAGVLAAARHGRGRRAMHATLAAISEFATVADRMPPAPALAVDAAAAQAVAAAGIAAGRAGNHDEVRRLLDGLEPDAWLAVELAHRTVARHVYASALHMHGERSRALQIIDAAIDELRTTGRESSIHFAYAEAQRFAIVERPTPSDHQRMRTALGLIEQQMLAATNPDQAAAFSRDLRNGRTLIAVRTREFTRAD